MDRKEIAIGLRRALEKLDGGRAWTQGAMARDAAGCPVKPDDRSAVCFCAVGATMAAAGEHPPEDILLDWLGDSVPILAGTEFNGIAHHNDRGIAHHNDRDGTTWPDIQALFDRAIARAECA